MMAVLARLLAAVVIVAGCAGHSHFVQGEQVHFYLRDGLAREVLFSFSLGGFGLQRAQKIDGVTWEVAVPGKGEFTYFYIVDGKVYRPNCPRLEMDDFGSYNCLYIPDP